MTSKHMQNDARVAVQVSFTPQMTRLQSQVNPSVSKLFHPRGDKAPVGFQKRLDQSKPQVLRHAALHRLHKLLLF